MAAQVAQNQKAQAYKVKVLPDLSAFVFAVWNINHRKPKELLLPEYLLQPQAVASSVVIGQGTSFSVTRKETGKPQEHSFRSVDREGFVATVAGTPKIPKYVVYKIAQVEFTSAGYAIDEHRTRYASVLLDILVLSHTPLMLHRNIVSLLGIAWGNNQYSATDRIPIPVVEYAHYGNLADLQHDHWLTPAQKTFILCGVGTGISFLHECGVTHGDIKSENILIFPDARNGFWAKISDFGFSALGGEGAFDHVPRGTSLWAAPEIKLGYASKDLLPQIDTFSFGLLAWRVAADGIDPLNQHFLIDEDPDSGEAAFSSQDAWSFHRVPERELIGLMKGDILVEKAITAKWLSRYQLAMMSKFRSNISKPQASPISTVADKFASQFSQNRLKMATSMVYLTSYRTCLDTVFSTTLRRDAQVRDLGRALIALRKETNTPEHQSRPEPAPINLTRLYTSLKNNGISVSWLAMRDIDPLVCDLLFYHTRNKTMDGATNLIIKPSLENVCAFCHMSGVGSDQELSEERSLSCLLRAAIGGWTAARALLYRMYDSCGKPVPSRISLVSCLDQCAKLGSRAALADLETVAGENVPLVLCHLMEYECGVGANFFHDENYLDGWTCDNVKSLPYVEESLRITSNSLEAIKVNVRGDRILHTAASQGIQEMVSMLITKYRISVDLQNDVGETALLCAMRSGNLKIVLYLLEIGANASITSSRGESPLHWLISLPELSIYHVTGKLMERGAEKCLNSCALRCDYAAVGISSFLDGTDKLTGGTPLHWAICRGRAFIVKVLLSHGARSDALQGPDQKSTWTCRELAAYYQEPYLLRFMIQRAVPDPRWLSIDMGNRVNVFPRKSPNVITPDGVILSGVSNLVKAAIDGSDRTSMIIRHGSRHRSRLRDTIVLLSEELSYVKLASGVDTEGRSPLQYAAYKGFHDVAELMFDYMDAAQWVNEPYGLEHTTPVFETVRRNHKIFFNMLLNKGARVDVKVDSPAHAERFDWCILHIAAEWARRNDLTLASRLLDLGVPTEGYLSITDPAETPLSIAIESNHFDFADLLRKAGADINALSNYIMGGRIRTFSPTTILGRIIAANLRYSGQRLRYVLWPKEGQKDFDQAAFIVVPELGLTALHQAALASAALESPIEQDEETRKSILDHLLQRFDEQSELDAQTNDDQMTALHLAAYCGNASAFAQLLEAGADAEIRNVNGETALDLMAREVEEHEESNAQSRVAWNPRPKIPALFPLSVGADRWKRQED